MLPCPGLPNDKLHCHTIPKLLRPELSVLSSSLWLRHDWSGKRLFVLVSVNRSRVGGGGGGGAHPNIFSLNSYIQTFFSATTNKQT